jgi:predicted MPP superfamily phosphohydrolase
MIQRPSRRRFLLLPLLGASGVAYAHLVEPAWLELTQRQCAIPNLAEPLELIHLSDFHACKDVPKSIIERAIDMATGANPDLICITGDFVTNTSGFDASWYTAVLRRLAAKAPSYAVLGNHDGGRWSAPIGGFRTTAEVTRIVESSGVSLLANRSQKFTRKGATLQIAGVGDVWAGDLDAAQAFRGVDSRWPTILLSHNPDTKELLAGHDWDLMLSGHTHGGQVVVPVIGLCPAPVVDRNYIAGLKPWRDRWIHVSRGVGNAHGVRFNCRPEVTRIRLIPGGAG